MEENNAFLVQEKLRTLMRKYAVPCVISLLVGALYNIVDQIFIANASYLGSFGNAANTVVFPLTVVALAIAVMIGDGCCAYVSICLGAKSHENAHKRQRSGAVRGAEPDPDGSLPDFSGWDPDLLRRTGQRGDVSVLQGVFLLYYAGRSVLYVRPGHEPGDSV